MYSLCLLILKNSFVKKGERRTFFFFFFSEKQNGLNFIFSGLIKKNTDILKNGHIVG